MCSIWQISVSLRLYLRTQTWKEFMKLKFDFKLLRLTRVMIFILGPANLASHPGGRRSLYSATASREIAKQCVTGTNEFFDTNSAHCYWGFLSISRLKTSKCEIASLILIWKAIHSSESTCIRGHFSIKNVILHSIAMIAVKLVDVVFLRLSHRKEKAML